MTRFHRVFSRIWASPDFRSWSEDGRAAALYLLTCPARSTEGLFRLPLPWAAYELQWTTERADAAFAELERAGFIATDRAADLVWLVNAVAWNPPAGPKQIKGAVNALGELPPTPLRAQYLNRCKSVCPQLAEAIVKHLGWSDTPPIQYPRGSDTPPIPQEPEPAPEPEPPPPADAPDTASPDAADSSTVVVADGLIARLGYADPPPAGPDIRGYVARAIGRGWAAEQLADLATEAGARDGVSDPLGWLRGALKRCANQDPPAAPAAPPRAAQAAGGADSWSTQWALMTGHRTRLANEAAKAAWFDTRQTRRYGTETDAKFAFRDAYVARSAEAATTAEVPA